MTKTKSALTSIAITLFSAVLMLWGTWQPMAENDTEVKIMIIFLIIVLPLMAGIGSYFFFAEKQ